MAKKEKDISETRIVRGAGDNNADKPIDGKKLVGFIEHLEKLDKKKDQIMQEIRETYADVKAIGYDTKLTRAMVNMRKIEPEKRKEKEELRNVYMAAIGLLDE